MAKLNIFAACGRVLLDPVEERVSIIDLLNSIQPEAVADPSEAGGARYLLPELFLLTVWLSEPKDENVTYEQQIEIVAASDGKVTHASGPLSYVLTDNVHNVVQPVRMSCRDTGDFEFLLYRRTRGEDGWGEPIAAYPFTVVSPAPRKTTPERFFQGRPTGTVSKLTSAV